MILETHYLVATRLLPPVKHNLLSVLDARAGDPRGTRTGRYARVNSGPTLKASFFSGTTYLIVVKNAAHRKANTDSNPLTT